MIRLLYTKIKIVNNNSIKLYTYDKIEKVPWTRDKVDILIDATGLHRNINKSKSVLRSIAKALDYDLDKLLSLANTVDDDIQNIINRRPAAVPDFLRTAKNLTNKEWIELTKHVEKMKNKGK